MFQHEQIGGPSPDRFALRAARPELSLQADCEGWDHLMMRVPFGHLDRWDSFWVAIYAQPGKVAGYIRFEWVTDLLGERAFLARELRSGHGEAPHPEPLLEGASSLHPEGPELA